MLSEKPEDGVKGASGVMEPPEAPGTLKNLKPSESPSRSSVILRTGMILRSAFTFHQRHTRIRAHSFEPDSPEILTRSFGVDVQKNGRSVAFPACQPAHPKGLGAGGEGWGTRGNVAFLTGRHSTGSYAATGSASAFHSCG